MTTTYLKAETEGGIQHPYFFNGRILTGRDLRDMQLAFVRRDSRLGQVIGEGVAYGLFVTADGTGVKVSAGLALNREGETLLLPSEVRLPLIPAQPVVVSSTQSPFQTCEVEGAIVDGGVAVGYYLLVITRATEQAGGQAPTTSLNGAPAGCAARYEVEGVQFKLIALPFVPAGPETSHRNLLAARCLGVPHWLEGAANPLTAGARYGLVDSLRAGGNVLTCDVPLAVLRWHNGAVQFTDDWAVRRAPRLPSGLSQYPLPGTPVPGFEALHQHTDGRRYGEAEAFFFQFQRQIESLRVGLSGVQNARADEHFHFLPAAGYLPLAGPGRAGFQWPRFFRLPGTPEPAVQDAAYLRELVHASFYIDPIEVVANQAVPVDVFTVPGAATAVPYVFFRRREPLVVVPPDDTPPADEPATEKGSLLVLVVGPDGSAVLHERVAKVIATASDGVQYAGQLVQSSDVRDLPAEFAILLKDALRSSETLARDELGIQRRGGAEAALGLRDNPFDKRQIAAYKFAVMPPGRATVLVTTRDFEPTSVSTTIPSGRRQVVVVRLKKRKGDTKPAGKNRFAVDAEMVTPGGHVIDKLYLDDDWRRQYLGRLPVPPEPDDWVRLDRDEVVLELEDALAQLVELSPALASQGPSIFVRKDYTPEALASEPYAMVATRDGSAFPVVLVPSTTAVPYDVATTRGGVRDIDGETFQNHLRGTGLESVDAFANAWTQLVGNVLGVSEAGAGGMIQTARSTVVSELRTSYTVFPGITPEAATALADRYADRVELSNADVADVDRLLGGDGSEASRAFAQRLIDRVRTTVPRSAWSLEALGLGTAEIATLGDRNIRSAGELSRHAELAGETLGLSTQAMATLKDRADAAVAGGKLQIATDPGVGGLRDGITDVQRERLVGAGFGSLTSLAGAPASEVAGIIGGSEAEAAALIDRAGTSMGVRLALEGIPVLDTGDETATTELLTRLRGQGIERIGDLRGVDETRLVEILGGDRALAGRVKAYVDTTFARGRVGRFR